MYENFQLRPSLFNGNEGQMKNWLMLDCRGLHMRATPDHSVLVVKTTVKSFVKLAKWWPTNPFQLPFLTHGYPVSAKRQSKYNFWAALLQNGLPNSASSAICLIQWLEAPIFQYQSIEKLGEIKGNWMNPQLIPEFLNYSSTQLNSW